MSEELVPQIRNTNELLSRIQSIAAELREAVAGYAKEARESAKLLNDSVRSQTETLADLELISRIAEMEALASLVEDEQDNVADEEAADADALRDLDQFFKTTADRISSMRNKRVRELLLPVFNVMEEDLDAHVAARPAGVDDLLDRSLAATRAVLGRRDDVVAATVAGITEMLDSLRKERESVRAGIAHLQRPRSEAINGEPTAYAVPFYVVEIEDGNKRTINVVGPSTLQKDAAAPLGLRLTPVRGFEGVANAIASKWEAFRGAPSSPTSFTPVEVSDAITGAGGHDAAGFLAASTARSIDLQQPAAGSTTLKQVVAREMTNAVPAAFVEAKKTRRAAEPAPSKPPSPEKLPIRSASGTAPVPVVSGASDGFERAVELIDRKQFGAALTVLRSLSVEAQTNPMIGMYMSLCVRELAASGESQA